MILSELSQRDTKLLDEKTLTELEGKDFYFTYDISDIAILCHFGIKMYVFLPVYVGKGVAFFENDKSIPNILAQAAVGEFGKIDAIRRKFMGITKTSSQNRNSVKCRL